MSISLIKQGDVYSATYTKQGKVVTEHCEFMVTGESDVASLPKLDKCTVGSVAYTADVNSVWMLGQDNAWHKVGG